MALPNGWPASGATGWAAALQGNVQYASDKAEAALSGASGVPGVAQADSFAGANDSAKMTAALSYAAAQTNIPWVQLPGRTWDTGSTTFTVFSGMKILGSGHQNTPQNPEISGGKLVTGMWKTSCGSGASSLMSNAGTVYDWNVSGVVFYGGSGSQIFRCVGNAYACGFHNLSFLGCKNAIGNPAEKFLATQLILSGHWTMAGFTDTTITVGGSDNLFSFYLNAESDPAGAGKPIVIFDYMQNTNVYYMYITAMNDWTGLQINGNDTYDTYFFGGTFEGKSMSNLSTRALVDVRGGNNVFFGTHFGQVSAGGAATGAIQQTAGKVTLYSPLYVPGTGVPATFPLLYQTGGTARVAYPTCDVVGQQVRLRWASGTTDTVPLPTNSYLA